MSEKVRLPKAICDALDRVRKDHYNSEIIYKRLEHTWLLENEILCDVASDLLMRALVLGYEPELTAEEQLKELYYTPYVMRNISQFDAYCKGIRDTLRIHGIHYDWLNGDAE